MADPDKSLAGRMAAHLRWGHTPDRAAATAPARAAAEERFYRQARELHPEATDEQIAAVARSLRSAHFIAMARRSAQARRRPKATAAEHLERAAAARAALDAAKAGR